MAAPLTYRLGEIAETYVSGFANVCRIGDSINSQETANRLYVGVQHAWRPNDWIGWSQAAGGPVNHQASAGTAGDRAGMACSLYWGQFAALTSCNRYAFVGGPRAFAAGGGGYDLAVEGSPNLGDTNAIPCSYREQRFPGGDPGAGVTIGKFNADSVVMNKFPGGNWMAKNDVVRGRLLYYPTPAGVTIKINSWRAGTGTQNTTTCDMTAAPQGAGRINWYDVDWNATTTSDNRQIILTSNTGSSGITTAKYFTLVAGRIWRPNMTTGLQFSVLANAGWDLADYNNRSLFSDNAFIGWFDAHGWPNILEFQLGENQSAGETAELNAGTTTTFRTNYITFINYIRGLYTAAGKPTPFVVIRSRYASTNGSLSDPTNALTVAQAGYEIADSIPQCAFVNLIAALPDKSVFTTGQSDSAGTTGVYEERMLEDGIHPDYVGARTVEGVYWNLVAGTAVAKAQLQYRQPLRGRP